MLYVLFSFYYLLIKSDVTTSQKIYIGTTTSCKHDLSYAQKAFPDSTSYQSLGSIDVRTCDGNGNFQMIAVEG